MKEYIKSLRDSWNSQLIREVNRISAIAQNENLRSKGYDWNDSELYSFYWQIHDILKMYDVIGMRNTSLVEKQETSVLKNVEYKRVGNEYDGGYVVASPLSRNKICYSIGISDDVSFDKDMVRNGYEIYQYDHTIKRLPETNEHFHWKKIGLTGNKGEADNLETLSQMINSNGHTDESGMFLKMDVEQCEWDVFNTIDSETLSKFDQIAIELHVINHIKNPDYIISGLRKLTENHSVIHVHGNNWDIVSYVGDLITPDTIEVTLVKNDLYELQESNVILPRLLDRPNVQSVSEVILGRWNND